MIDELCASAEVELHDARVMRLAVNLLSSEVVLDVRAFRVDSEEQQDAVVVFGGVRWMSIENLLLERIHGAGQRIDVGDGFPPNVEFAHRDTGDVVWVFFSESNSFLLMGVSSVRVESALGSWSVDSVAV